MSKHHLCDKRPFASDLDGVIMPEARRVADLHY